MNNGKHSAKKPKLRIYNNPPVVNSNKKKKTKQTATKIRKKGVITFKTKFPIFILFF